VEVDARSDAGPGSVAALASSLEPSRGLAIVTEGLLTYLGEDDVVGMWRRFARELGRFSAGLYLADLPVGGSYRALIDRGFTTVLSAFVRGGVHSHFGSAAATADTLREAGFPGARLHRCDRHPAAGDAARDPAASRLHIVEATTGDLATSAP
jgi:O-methyltransferase involved in polyketide biosynthesis